MLWQEPWEHHLFSDQTGDFSRLSNNEDSIVFSVRYQGQRVSGQQDSCPQMEGIEDAKGPSKPASGALLGPTKPCFLPSVLPDTYPRPHVGLSKSML